MFRLHNFRTALALVAVLGVAACLDGSLDGALATGNEPGEVCTPETDEAFCARLSEDCAPLSGVDNCGTPRTVEACQMCERPRLRCGDGRCQASESCTSCPGDCGACPSVCGDGKCESGESCSSCPGDCGALPPGDCTGAYVTSHGAKGDGVTDDTAAFRAAAATGQTMCIPKPAAHYKLTGVVSVKASVQGIGLPLIRMYGATGAYWTHVVFAVDDYAGAGLVISGVHLDGQWREALGHQDGEWSHLIQIRGSKNVTVQDCLLENAHGDGVLVGGEWGWMSENVVIRRNTIVNPLRCDIALIWVKGVIIEENVLKKANDYVTAIDAEPNPPGSGLGRETDWDIMIRNNQFEVPRQVAVMLYYNDPAYVGGGNVTVTGNTGTALRFFVQVGNWQNVQVWNNF